MEHPKGVSHFNTNILIRNNNMYCIPFVSYKDTYAPVRKLPLLFPWSKHTKIEPSNSELLIDWQQTYHVSLINLDAL